MRSVVHEMSSSNRAGAGCRPAADPPAHHSLWPGQRVRLAGHGRQGGGDGLEVGLDVGRCGRAGAVGVVGVGAGDALSVVAFDRGQGGMAEPWVEMPCAVTQGSRRPRRVQRWS